MICCYCKGKKKVDTNKDTKKVDTNKDTIPYKLKGVLNKSLKHIYIEREVL